MKKQLSLKLRRGVSPTFYSTNNSYPRNGRKKKLRSPVGVVNNLAKKKEKKMKKTHRILYNFASVFIIRKKPLLLVKLSTRFPTHLHILAKRLLVPTRQYIPEESPAVLTQPCAGRSPKTNKILVKLSKAIFCCGVRPL